jgi:hypothetical protein
MPFRFKHLRAPFFPETNALYTGHPNKPGQVGLCTRERFDQLGVAELDGEGFGVLRRSL